MSDDPSIVDRLKHLAHRQIAEPYIWLLMIISSGCFSLAWCSIWFGSLLWVAIVPILFIIKVQINRPKGIHGLYYVFFTLILWHIGTIWWIRHASLIGLLFAIAINATSLFFPWLFYYYVRKWSNLYAGYIGLVAAWLTLEYMHLNWEYWEFSFPWLNLGNGLAALVPWIQWYEYTGILGGSLWVLVVNILLYHLLFEATTSFICKWLGSCLLLPIWISLSIYYSYKEKGPPVEAVIVQPNLDSYTEKDCHSTYFVPYVEQIERLLNLSKAMVTPSTAVVIWPESAIDALLNEAYLHNHFLIRPIQQFMRHYTAATLIAGLSSSLVYGRNCPTITARQKSGSYYDIFNSVAHFKRNNEIEIYHKIKRVPGGEYIPYFQFFPKKLLHWIRQVFENIGDIDPSFGKGSAMKIFEVNDQVSIAPVICYESLYGAFIGQAIQKKASLLAILTNDGWWQNTPIYHHHFQYSRLLAIAHRRSVLRAANTGISGFISQRGAIIAKTKRLKAAVTRQVVYANQQLTFYSLHGDYIGYMASWICLLLLLYVVGNYYKKRKSIDLV